MLLYSSYAYCSSLIHENQLEVRHFEHVLTFLSDADLLLKEANIRALEMSPSEFFKQLVLIDREMQSTMLEQGNCRGLRFTKKANASFTDKYKQQIVDVFKYFPELHNEIVYVGWIAPHGWARGCCCVNASTDKPLKISLQPNEKNFTIAHEFTHLLQARKKEELGIPSGERACDIWALTRLPLELIDDYPSYIGSHPMRKHWDAIKQRVKELAIQAIEVRKTNRRYIVWFEDEIKKLVIVSTRKTP